MASNRIPDKDNEGNNNNGNGDDDGNDNDAELDQGPGGLFSTNKMEFFQLALAEVVLPTSVGCLPSQLGNAKCGKLKALQWYTLFVYVIPLIVADIFVTNINRIVESSNQALIMENIACLIQCTHIVNSRCIKDVHRKRFEDSYEKYTLTSQKLFQHLSILPNHHDALHVPQQQESWGPLGEVAEFTGKRMIGKIGEIRTNNRLGLMFREISDRSWDNHTYGFELWRLRTKLAVYSRAAGYLQEIILMATRKRDQKSGISPKLELEAMGCAPSTHRVQAT
ncbi:hypothetical protein PCANC_04511 [Puccinia coronata f. sp. avenae]|uniref:Uncharacterized protein n=1 Tax=Puccinia coronata f. sp. avenae TaxID=200324 RepID=A0A2N5VW61_9BASI|nr:hypothetical protein PCANC_04511 [Puccinia coronata f. sp. avenae]